MLSSGMIVRPSRMCSIKCYECGEGEGCLVIYDLVAFFRAKKRKVNVGDAWFRFSSLSLTLSAWSSSLRVSSVFFWSGSAVEKFVLYSVFPFWSEQIGISLFFTAKVTNWPKNLLLIIFIFTQISSAFRYALFLCAEAPFSILKKVSALITSGEFSHGR